MPRNRSATEPRQPNPTPVIDSQSFIKFFKDALKDDLIKQSLRNIIRSELEEVVKPLKNEINKQRAIIKALEAKTNVLEKSVDQQEQYTRRENLRLSGLKEEKDENLEEKVLDIVNNQMALSPPLHSTDFARIHRVGAPDPSKPRQIIVKMNNYRVRARVFSNKKKLAGTPLSLNEDLTRIRSSILYRARQAKKQNKIQEAWSHDGRINVRDNKGKIHFNVDTLQLDQIINGKKNRSPPPESDSASDIEEGHGI